MFGLSVSVMDYAKDLNMIILVYTEREDLRPR